MSLIDNVITAIFNQPRSLGTIAIQCTLEEHHYDELMITDHPVEQGATISDHAFMRPFEVVIRAGWSNSGLQSVITDISDVVNEISALIDGTEGINLPFNYAAQVYEQLQILQQSRQPFEIITGKRTYENMLMRSLSVTTDEKTENALLVTAVCRQVITVETVAVPFPTLTNLSNPSANAPVVSQSSKSLIPGSALNKSAAGLIPGFPSL